MNTESDLCSILEPFHPSNKCAQIAKEWLDKGLAKCHEIAVLFPSQNTPPVWIDSEIEGIAFVDTSTRTEEASRVRGREPSAKAAKPRSSFCLHTSSFSSSVANPKSSTQNPSSLSSPPTRHQSLATRYGGEATIQSP